jgi:hypothetical protein
MKPPVGKVIGISAGWILLLGGCTSQYALRGDDMTPGRIHGRSLVFMKAGQQYEFRRISFVPDSLVGEIRVETEKRAEDGTAQYVEEEQAFRIPMANVDSVAVIKRDPGKTLLFGAGIAAGVALISNLVDTSLPKKSSSDGGKNPEGQ